MLKQFLRNQSGASAIEYALIAMGVASMIVSALSNLGTNSQSKFATIVSAITK